MNSKISIIVPTYNRVHFLHELIKSLEEQTYQDWECLIIDDGSVDKTKEMVLSWSKRESRIRFYQREELPKGAPTCRNIGIENASGFYLMFLDSDDFLKPYCLKSRIDAINRDSNLDFVVKNGVFCDRDGKLLKRVWNVENSDEDLIRFLHGDCIWSMSGGLFKLKFIRDNKITFDPALAVFQDLDFHIRVLSISPCYKKFLSDKPDHVIRRHGSNSISQKSNPDFSISAYLISKKLMRSYTILSEHSKTVLMARYYYDLQTLFFHKHFLEFFKEIFKMKQSFKSKAELILLTFYTICYLKLKGERPSTIKSNIHELITEYHNYPRTIGVYESN